MTKFVDRVRRFIRDGKPPPVLLDSKVDDGSADRYQDFLLVLSKRKGLREDLLAMGDRELAASFKRLMAQTTADNVPRAQERSQLRKHIRRALELELLPNADGWPDDIKSGDRFQSAAIRRAVAWKLNPASGPSYCPSKDPRRFFEDIWERYFPPEHRLDETDDGPEAAPMQLEDPHHKDIAHTSFEVIRRQLDLESRLGSIRRQLRPELWDVFLHLVQGGSDKEAPGKLGVARATFYRRQGELVTILKKLNLTFPTWQALVWQYPGGANLLKLAPPDDKRR